MVSPSSMAASLAYQSSAAYQSNSHNSLSAFSSYLNDLWIGPLRNVESCNWKGRGRR